MESDVYTVPAEVLFRNYSTTSGPQTRNLLIKNNTNQALHTIISYPFSPSFRLHAPADLRAELKPTPPHLVLDLQPNSTTKVVLELKVPEPTSSAAHPHLHDALVVLCGGVRSLLVPLRAVHHGLDAAAASGGAGGAAHQQAALMKLAFWPTQKELDSHSTSFTEQVRAVYGIHGPPPTISGAAAVASAGPAGSTVAGASAVHVAAVQAAPPAAAARQSGVAAGGAGPPGGTGASTPAVGAGAIGAARGTSTPAADGAQRQHHAAAAAAPPPHHPEPPAPQPRPLPELPPEGFSKPQAAYGGNDIFFNDDDDDVQQPFVVQKTVKVQGRVAVAVPAGGPDGAAAAGGGGRAGGSVASALPPGESFNRTNSGLGTAAGARPDSAGKLAFVLNGRFYDARGSPMDPAAEHLLTAGPLTVVDCDDASTPRTSRPGNGTGSTPPRLTPPPGSAVAGSAATAAGSGAANSGPGRVSLAPLKHGNVPFAASLRPGSASSTASTPLGRQPAASAGAAQAGAGSDDPLRQAALAAAMRELGITDLPTPSSNRPPPAPGAPDWSRPSAQPAASPLPPALAMPSFVQYGLPPNYRPSSGRGRPASANGAAAPSDSHDDEDSHDDADLEARLLQQIETNVLRTAGPAPAPAPRRPQVTGRGAASPGSYLPPRAGAAPSGGLGAASPAAAAAAAVAAGSRLGRAAAAGAAAAGSGGHGTRRPAGQSAADNDYPEESEFEMQLQRQIDSDVANGGGTPSGPGAGRSATAGAGGGGGGGWRGSSGAAAAAASRGAPPKPAAAAAAHATGLKRSNSSGGSGASAGVAGGRRLSADSGTPDKAPAAARAGSNAVPRSGTGANGAPPGPSAPQAARTGKPAAAVPRATAAPAAAAAAGKTAAGRSPTATPPAANVQRLKANWDALG